ncbi:MAG: Stp1/IreP family PP2C-type Ser/Thr phosphatase [Anaerolineae bacterium]|nr:Stp1/IreP family PP2C-type Ser/Thr phosphatase [Anaerolineae bacterium]
MNLFRRLFSQEKEEEPASAPAPSSPPPMSDVPPVVKPPSEATTAPLTPPTAQFGALFGDGATRPLPEDALSAFLGNGHLAFGQATDIGMVRGNNQDAIYSYFVSSRSVEERPDFGLFLVADGMGGHHDGEKASSLTARVVASQVLSTIVLPHITGDNENQEPITEALTSAIEKANSEVIKHVPDGGTTVTSVIVIGDLAYIAHVGDSRIYLLAKDHLEQLTRDHSLVQRLIELDQLTPAEAAEHPNKNMLYRALGQNEAIEVDTLTRRLPPKSRLLLCSDGLWNQVEEKEIVSIVKQTPNPQEACNKLIALANKHGGVDNVSVILLQMPG